MAKGKKSPKTPAEPADGQAATRRREKKVPDKQTKKAPASTRNTESLPIHKDVVKMVRVIGAAEDLDYSEIASPILRQALAARYQRAAKQLAAEAGEQA